MFNVGGKELYGLLAQGCCYNFSLGPSSTVGKGKKNLLSHPLFSFFLTVEPGPRLLEKHFNCSFLFYRFLLSKVK